MPTRFRSRSEKAGYGTKTKNNGTLISTHANHALYESIEDVVAKGDGHDLTITRNTLVGCMIPRSCSPGNFSGVCLVNIQPDRMRNPVDVMYQHSAVDRPTLPMLAADLLAKTNPSRPVVDLPIAVYELKDIPSLLKKEGGDWIKKLASANLKWHFALKPLISDITNLLNFSDEVAKRQKELEALAMSGLRRKRTLHEGQSFSVVSNPVHSDDKFLIYCSSAKTTIQNTSGFVRWFPSDPKMMKGDSRALAKKAVLGLTIDFSTAWNAIPWSWLIDWCSNVGDILIANRNLVGAYHDDVKIMTHTTTQALCTFDRPDVVKIPGYWTKETKTRRTVANVPVSAQLPILSLRQLSILGSIAVTRRTPKS